MFDRPARTLLVLLGIVSLTLSTGLTTLNAGDGKLRYLQQIEQQPPAWTAAMNGLSGAACEDGFAAIFPCENVDLASFVPLAQLGGPTGNDVWGWTDPETGDEYAIMGTSAGTAFVDVTDPFDPEVVGIMPSQSLQGLPLWRDIKVHADHAYVVSEHAGHGMQIFDLTRLRDASSPIGLVADQLMMPDSVYFGPDDHRVSNSHNVVINEETGFGYLVGTNTCAGGLHMVDLADPLAPVFAGCFDEDGYTHDVECVVYAGPDARHQGDEICFASNEDTVTIVDVTDKANPVMLSRTGYDSAAYTHQGALTEDQATFIFNDELDEQSGTVDNTTTYFLDVSDLRAPGEVRSHTHATSTVDHNHYVHGDLLYQAHYNQGLRISEIDASGASLDEIAFFDVVPAVDVSEFAGAWSSFRFGSGTTVVSTLEAGLFVLLPDLPADLDPGAPGDDEVDEDVDGRPQARPECADRPGNRPERAGPPSCRGR